MDKTALEAHKHDHIFGQDQKKGAETKTAIVIAVTATMMVVEIIAGSIFGSMALLADGIHMASHAVALGISAFAYVYARKRAHDQRFSFGTGKVNALGGFTGAILLGMFALAMVWESIERLLHPVEIAFNQAMIVAVVGLIVNGLSALILGDDHDHGHDHNHHHDGHDDHNHEHHSDHNLRAAYLHVLADALTSLTAIAALYFGKRFSWVWMDPLMGIAGSILVASWAWGLLKQTSSVLLDHQAEDAAEKVRKLIETGPDTQIADLHVWSIAPGQYSLSLSIAAAEPQPAGHYKQALSALPEIVHTTVEVHPVG